MQNVANKTHRNDLYRAPFLGILETGWSTFALVIAIRYFNADETIKAWITGAGPMGFLLAPLSLYLGAVCKLSAHQACALLYALTAIFLCIALCRQSGTHNYNCIEPNLRSAVHPLAQIFQIIMRQVNEGVE